MTKNTAAATTEPTPCECSKYDAVRADQLTEENLASGSYDVADTGCTATTKNLFAPGHDAKLKSFLIRHAGPEWDIRKTDGGAAVSNDAQGHADKYDFGYMVAAGIAKVQAKAEAKAKKAADRAAKKAAPKAKAPKKVTAKVGRWERTGTVTDGVFTYEDAKGNTKTTTAFKLV